MKKLLLLLTVLPVLLSCQNQKEKEYKEVCFHCLPERFAEFAKVVAGDERMIDYISIEHKWDLVLQYKGNNQFLMHVMDFAGFYMKEINDTIVRTYFNYYMYYSNGELHEYGAITVGMDFLDRFVNKDEVINLMTTEGYEISEVMVRANGIVNINTFLEFPEARDMRHGTFRMEGDSLVIVPDIFHDSGLW
ncbi:MAG: hypothetical protein HUK15_05265, partial [Bacteroidales bacterium]|nr:hypothetical protein [Bacteroidales bacterium]